MKPLNNLIGEYLDFCAQAFWGRWNISFLRLCLLFVVAIALIYTGRANNILFGEIDVWSILITALGVTAVTSFLALARKHKRI